MPEQTFRLGAHVDGVNGYPNCLLSITPEAVSIGLDGGFDRLFRPRAAARTVVHQGGVITLTHLRWRPPWQRVALLLFDDEHQVAVFMSRKKAAVVAQALRNHGHDVREIDLGPFDGPEAVVALERYRYRVRRRGR